MTEQDAHSRQRTGRLVAIATMVWWLATIGGIIWSNNPNA